MLLLSFVACRVVCDWAGIKTKSPAFRKCFFPDTDASIGPETFNKKYGQEDGVSENVSALDSFRSYTFTGFWLDSKFALGASIELQLRFVVSCRISTTM